MTPLVDRLVSDQLWAIVQPLLPPPPRPPYGGRRRTISDRNCFAAIVYMARTYPVAAAGCQGIGVRLAGDRLAPPCRVGQGGRVRAAAPRHSRPTRRAGPAGL